MWWKTLVVVTALALVGCAPANTYTHGVLNLHQIREDFYRSGQPKTLEEWKYLHDVLGVTDSFKLDFDDEGDESLARVAGITVHNLGIEPTTDPDSLKEIIDELFKRPAPDRIEELKRLIIEVWAENIVNHAQGKKLRIAIIHCYNGHDRTGLGAMFVRYKIDKWPKSKAWKEARKLGFHPELIGLVREWEELE